MTGLGGKKRCVIETLVLSGSIEEIYYDYNTLLLLMFFEKLGYTSFDGLRIRIPDVLLTCGQT